MRSAERTSSADVQTREDEAGAEATLLAYVWMKRLLAAQCHQFDRYLNGRELQRDTSSAADLSHRRATGSPLHRCSVSMLSRRDTGSPADR